MNDRPPLVLASGSPRRLHVLSRLGIVPDHVFPANVDETPVEAELPRALAIRLARIKAAVVVKQYPDAVVLAADTVVGLGRRVLGKPSIEAEASRFLEMLSGRRHRVVTAICVISSREGRRERLVSSALAFQRLTSAEIADYVGSGEWRGCAGGYSIQGRAEAFVRFLSGSHSGVVGLPMFETTQILRGVGWLP